MDQNDGIADVKLPINIQSLKVAENTLQNEGSGQIINMSMHRYLFIFMKGS